MSLPLIPAAIVKAGDVISPADTVIPEFGPCQFPEE